MIRGFIQAGLLYEDAEHYNCVFVGRDSTGKPVFANKRGTASSQAPYPSFPPKGRKLAHSAAPPFPTEPASLGFGGSPVQGGSGFKGNAAGNNQDIAFRLPGDPGNDAVLVFEAPIDLMSYCTLHREVTRSAVALCGLYQGPLDTYLRENPHIRRIILCLDADGPGRQAAQRMKDAYEARGYSVTLDHPAQGKDWNEYLQQRGQAQERRR